MQPNNPTNLTSQDIFKQCFDRVYEERPVPPLETGLPDQQKVRLLTNDVQKHFNEMISRDIARTGLDVLKLCNKLSQQPDEFLPEEIKIDPGLKKAYDKVHFSKSHLKKMADEKNCISFKSKGSIGYWITISPPPGFDNLDSIRQIMANLTEKAVLKENYYIYNIEWRDHIKETGCHVHLYIERDMENSQDPSTQLRPFKKLQKWNIPAKGPAVKYKYVHTSKGQAIIMEYLYGKKKQTKLEQVNKDILLRAKYEIPTVIEHVPEHK